LIGERWNSNIVAVESYRRADCVIDNYLVVAKVEERLSVSKE
jgi:hypothetical protein